MDRYNAFAELNGEGPPADARVEAWEKIMEW